MEGYCQVGQDSFSCSAIEEEEEECERYVTEIPRLVISLTLSTHIHLHHFSVPLTFAS